MNDWYTYLILFLVGLLVTILTTPLAKRIAWKVNAVDYPSAWRINKQATPRVGGIAIFLGLAGALITQYVGTVYFDWPVVFIPHPSMVIEYRMLAVSVLVMFMVGFLDDVFSLKPLVKFAGQTVAAIIAVASGLVIYEIVDPFGSEAALNIGWIAYPITVLYLVAFANIVNLIDGLDGLAAGISGIVSLSLFVIAIMFGRPDAAALSIALAGCCLGFLRYNFHPASIFMGDCGSNTLGFLLGIVSLLNVSRTAALTTILVPLIFAGVPIIDTFAAIVRRKRGHMSIAQRDKGHIQHRLMQRGYDQRKAAMFVYAWSAFLSIGAILITQVDVIARIVIFIILLLASFLFVHKLHLFEPVLRHHYNKDTQTDEILPADSPVFKEEESAEK